MRPRADIDDEPREVEVPSDLAAALSGTIGTLQPRTRT